MSKESLVIAETDQQRWTTVRHYAYVPRLYEDAERLLAAEPEAVVVGEPGQPRPSVSPLHARLGRLSLTRSARVHLGPISRDSSVIHLNIRWEDSERPRLFPVLEAVLSLAPVPSAPRPVTQVGLVGRYRPPLGPVGELGDRLAGQSVAADAVAGFVADIASRLEFLLPESVDGTPSAEADPGPETSRILIPLDHLQRRRGGAAGVSRQLAATPGVVRSQVNPITGLATVEYLPGEVHLEDLLDELGVD